MAKKKKKSAPIFPPETAETGKANNPQMALADPAAAASMASGYAGLGSVGAINEITDSFAKQIEDDIDGQIQKQLEIFVIGDK